MVSLTITRWPPCVITHARAWTYTTSGDVTECFDGSELYQRQQLVRSFLAVTVYAAGR